MNKATVYLVTSSIHDPNDRCLVDAYLEMVEEYLRQEHPGVDFHCVTGSTFRIDWSADDGDPEIDMGGIYSDAEATAAEILADPRGTGWDDSGEGA